ncbi:PH domain-containing protein [Patescibacteria group bacterium]|nr:PH domain-containing protein [Patescibacteria group bacterium]
MDSDTGLTKEKYPLNKNKPLKKTISIVFSTSFIVFFLLIAFSVPMITILTTLSDSIPVFDLIFKYLYLFPIFYFMFIVLVFIYQKIYIKYYFYHIGDNYLSIKKGIFAPHEIIVPWEKIQDIYVDQDVFDRILGLYDVHISTATIISRATAHIDGVNQKNAYELRTILLEKVRSHIRPSGPQAITNNNF